MIDDEDDKPAKVKFGRSQKFRLTAQGKDAATAYVEMIEAAKRGSGRADFDAARKTWAAPRGLAPEDGLFLSEFGDGHTLQEAQANLQDTGTSAKEVKAALEKLMKAGLIEAVPPPPEPPRPAYTPPRFRY